MSARPNCRQPQATATGWRSLWKHAPGKSSVWTHDGMQRRQYKEQNPAEVYLDLTVGEVDKSHSDGVRLRNFGKRNRPHDRGGGQVYNILGIGGVTALIAPTTVPPEIVRFDNLVMVGVCVVMFPHRLCELRARLCVVASRHQRRDAIVHRRVRRCGPPCANRRWGLWPAGQRVGRGGRHRADRLNARDSFSGGAESAIWFFI